MKVYSLKSGIHILGEEIPGALKVLRSYPAELTRHYIKYAYWPNSMINFKSHELGIFSSRKAIKLKYLNSIVLYSLFRENLLFAMQRNEYICPYNIFEMQSVCFRETRKYIERMPDYYIWKWFSHNQKHHLLNSYPEMFSDYVNLNESEWSKSIHPDAVFCLKSSQKMRIA